MKPYQTARKGALAVTTALTLLISGCSVALLPEKHALRIFTLPYAYTASEAPDTNEVSAPVLKIVRPQANGILNGKRIVIETAPNELAAYGEVQWMTDGPALLRDHLIRALRSDPRLGTVVSDTSAAGSDITLTSDLQAFQESRTGQTPTIHLYLQAQLVENGSRRTLATQDFEVKVPIEGDGIEHVIEGFGKAADQLSSELADWIMTAREAFQSRSSGNRSDQAA